MGREIWIYRGKKWLIGVDVERREFRSWTDCEGLDVGRVWAHVDLTALNLAHRRIPIYLDVYLYGYFMGIFRLCSEILLDCRIR